MWQILPPYQPQVLEVGHTIDTQTPAAKKARLSEEDNGQ